MNQSNRFRVVTSGLAAIVLFACHQAEVEKTEIDRSKTELGSTAAKDNPPNSKSDGILPICSDLGERSCILVGGAYCRPDYCPACSGGPTFVGCSNPRDPAPACDPLMCPCRVMDEAGCGASDRCHSVYVDPGTCACVPAGCCAHFDRCADGAQADCSGRNLTCRPPAPHCEGPYVISYVDHCYEGCVREDECAEDPVFCWGPNPHFPSFDKTCQADSDCDFGIHQIDCCGSTAAIGFNRAERARFDQDETTCDAQYPVCDCLERPTVAEDGQHAPDRSRLAASCDQGRCSSFVR